MAPLGGIKGGTGKLMFSVSSLGTANLFVSLNSAGFFSKKHFWDMLNVKILFNFQKRKGTSKSSSLGSISGRFSSSSLKFKGLLGKF